MKKSVTGTLFTDLVLFTHPLPYKDLSLSREKMEILVSHELKQKLPLLIEMKMEEIMQELAVLRQGVQELLVSKRRLRPVHEWWLKQHNDRSRQSLSRVKKRDLAVQRQLEHRERTRQNDARHSLTRSIESVAGPSPAGRVRDGMGVRLGRYTMDPQSWIRTQAGLQPRKTIAYLVSLYNGSYWVPWIQQYGDGKMKLFSGWDEESNPTFTFAAKGDVVVKTSPPAKWEANSIIKFSDAHMWKVFAVVQAFLDDVDPDLEGPDFAEFRSYVDVMSQFSSYKVFGTSDDTEWAPTYLATWDDPAKALRAFRKVAPRVAVLRAAFLEGISTPFDSIVST